jgi:glycosyltransferase involved in cell wall biosynthesis
MRILIATSHRNLVGGTERYLQVLIPGLTNRGHQLSVVYEHHFDSVLETIDGAGFSLASWCLAELGLECTLQLVAEWKPDVVYSNGLEAADFQSALLDAYPTVLYAHNYYGTCATGQKCHSFPQVRPCVRRFGPRCLVLYYPRRCGGLHPRTMWQMFQRYSEINRRLPDYHAVLVASKHMYREFQQHGVRSDRIHLVPLPTPEATRAPAVPGPHVPRSQILFVGRLTKLKGSDRLIQAIPSASERLGRAIHLTIGGDGPERRKLENLAHRFGVVAKFLGWVRTRQKMDLMREADLLAVPSLWPEPFGLVGIEAGSYGVPAVAYNVGGISDWLIPGKSGELAPSDPPTVEGLANAIVRALADPHHYAKLRRGAWEMATRFTLNAHLAKLEAILRAASTGRQHPYGEGIHA